MTALAQSVASSVGRFGRGIDRVALGIVAVLAVIAVAFPYGQFQATVGFTVDALLNIAPYLLASVLLAAWLGAAGADRLIGRVFQGHIAKAIVVAAVFGGLSPFCSCGVIPLIAAALAVGVPLSAVMAFWIASPLMSPDMFLVTAGVLGMHFAVGKTLAAVGIGLFGGFATLALQRTGGFENPLRPAVGDGGCGGSAVRNPKDVVWRFWEEPERRGVFAGKARQNGLFLLKWMTLAFILESLMLAYLPEQTVAQWLGPDSTFALPLAVLIGMPAYMNGYAAVPLVDALMQTGMAVGPAMAFLLAGGVSSIPAAVAVYALVRLPVFMTYLGLATVGSAVAGLLYGLAV
ncbi:MAG: permease [Acetobacterales bacterium]